MTKRKINSHLLASLPIKERRSRTARKPVEEPVLSKGISPVERDFSQQDRPNVDKLWNVKSSIT